MACIAGACSAGVMCAGGGTGAPAENDGERKSLATRMGASRKRTLWDARACRACETALQRGPDDSDRNAFDLQRLALQVDDDRLELGVLGDQFDTTAFLPQPLDRHVVTQARHHDLAVERLGLLVHGEPVA